MMRLRNEQLGGTKYVEASEPVYRKRCGADFPLVKLSIWARERIHNVGDEADLALIAWGLIMGGRKEYCTRVVQIETYRAID